MSRRASSGDKLEMRAASMARLAASAWAWAASRPDSTIHGGGGSHAVTRCRKRMSSDGGLARRSKTKLTSSRCDQAPERRIARSRLRQCRSPSAWAAAAARRSGKSSAVSSGLSGRADLLTALEPSARDEHGRAILPRLWNAQNDIGLQSPRVRVILRRALALAVRDVALPDLTAHVSRAGDIAAAAFSVSAILQLALALLLLVHLVAAITLALLQALVANHRALVVEAVTQRDKCLAVLVVNMEGAARHERRSSQVLIQRGQGSPADAGPFPTALDSLEVVGQALPAPPTRGVEMGTLQKTELRVAPEQGQRLVSRERFQPGIPP
eukprot:scaffold3473_cov122-Isochrysis_galbana.AAC.5